MEERLIEELINAYRESLESGGIDKIIELLIPEHSDSILAQMVTFDTRTIIERANSAFNVQATMNITERHKFVYRGESLFNIDFEQEKLPFYEECVDVSKNAE